MKTEKTQQKVFCIGLSRTGTTSIHELLIACGLESKNFIHELIYNDDWEVLDKYDAFSDAPLPLIYKKCDELFPNSKFILTTRNKKDWLDSMKWMYKHGRVIWGWTPVINQYHKKLYQAKRFNKQKLSQAYDSYHENVRTYFGQRNNLLEIDIDKGFDVGAICSFLNVEPKSIEPNRSNKRINASAIQFLKYYLFSWIIYPTKALLKGKKNKTPKWLNAI